jgi:hypothetical protein
VLNQKLSIDADYFGLWLTFRPAYDKYLEGVSEMEICEVQKEIYVPSPESRVATSVSMTYIGEGLRLQETQSQVRSSDWSNHVRCRHSGDNGKSWSDWDLVYEEAPTQGEYTQSGGPGPGGTGPFDRTSGCLVKPVFQRVIKGSPEVAMSELWKGNRLFCDHGFYQLSKDDGRTWSEGGQLNYEEGPDFDH